MELSDQRGRAACALVGAVHATSIESQAPFPFKRFNSSPEVIRLGVLMYVRCL